MTADNNVATRSRLRRAGDSGGMLRALRRYADRGLGGSVAWSGTDTGLEADTRQIRNFDLSKLSGACEVRLGLRLAT